jgi:hypothetical protein
VLGLSLFGVVLGVAGGEKSCLLSNPPICADPPRNNHVFAIISAFVVLIVVVAIHWSRQRDRSRGGA